MLNEQIMRESVGTLVRYFLQASDTDVNAALDALEELRDEIEPATRTIYRPDQAGNTSRSGAGKALSAVGNIRESIIARDAVAGFLRCEKLSEILLDHKLISTTITSWPVTAGDRFALVLNRR